MPDAEPVAACDDVDVCLLTVRDWISKTVLNEDFVGKRGIARLRPSAVHAMRAINRALEAHWPDAPKA